MEWNCFARRGRGDHHYHTAATRLDMMTLTRGTMAQEDDEGRKMGCCNHWFVFLYYILLIYNTTFTRAQQTWRGYNLKPRHCFKSLSSALLHLLNKHCDGTKFIVILSDEHSNIS